MSRPVALITGASAGIGLAFARALAARGHDLVLVARRRERLDALAAELTAAHAGLRAHVVAADLGAPAGVAGVVAAVAAAGLEIDLLVNNAGFGALVDFAQQDPANAAGQVAVNVAALVALCSAYVPAMVARKRGAVVNVASTAAFQPVPHMAVYGATKAFVLSFSEALHEEVRAAGVKVVALCPGATATEFFAIAGEGAAMAMKRTVDDVVRTALRALERNHAVAVDGPLNTALTVASRLAPRLVIRRMVERMMRTPA